MIVKQFLALVLGGALILGTNGCDPMATEEVQSTGEPPIQPAQVTVEQLQQLVAPIALYPDELVGEVLAASTYPTEIVEANRWLQQNSSLKGDQLASEVDKQLWDPSVKALTQFPSVLANMSKNLSWTSALGEAYFNQPQEVLDAVQVMRKRAQEAGTLKTTPQQTVTTEGQTIMIEPTNPEVVFLPTYDPWIVYGPPVVVYPGYVGDFFVGPFIGFGVGFNIDRFHHYYPWGWHYWAATGMIASSFLITTGSFPEVTFLLAAGKGSVVPAFCAIVIFEAACRTSIIGPLVVFPCRMSSHRAGAAYLVDSTMAA